MWLMCCIKKEIDPDQIIFVVIQFPVLLGLRPHDLPLWINSGKLRNREV